MAYKIDAFDSVDDIVPIKTDGYFTAFNRDSGETIAAENLDTLKKLVTFLNGTPVGYVTGPEEKLRTITPQDRKDDDEDLVFLDNEIEVSKAIIHGSPVYGIYLAPL